MAVSPLAVVCVVAGAAATVLKWFFDETFVIPNPKVPTSDGLGLMP